MTKAFDSVASTYDATFTNTSIGRAQRNRVWAYLKSILAGQATQHILELNCGTGEDAHFLAQLGHQILATDTSTKMLQQVQVKAASLYNTQILTQPFDLANPRLLSETTFDLVFSNFGGLNCLSNKELKNLAEFLSQHLKPNGNCILIIMPSHTLLEKWYRWYKGESATYKNRASNKPIWVKVGTKQVATYFHTSQEVRQCFKGFQCKQVLPVGFIPSYFHKHSLLPLLSFWDGLVCSTSSFANYADHYLIHLQKKE